MSGFSCRFDREGDPALVRRVLEDLPDWFGLPEAVEGYVTEAAALPMVRVLAPERPVGFASLRQGFPETVEISCMGVLASLHGQGAGRCLMAGIVKAARAIGARMLMVRTLGPSDPDPFYAATRRFYAAAGFLPLAEIPEIWGPESPCLILARPLPP